MNRNLALEFVRVTEMAAIASARLMGRGDEKAADQAAVDAMRTMLDSVDCHAIVVIGEGERDEAPMLYIGEKVGAGKFMMVFMALIFLSAGIFGFATNFFNKKRNKINYQSIIASIALGALNYASTITILKSLTFYADSIFFPIYNSGYIAISALVGFILFKEKLRGVNFLGIALAMIAIIIITSGI